MAIGQRKCRHRSFALHQGHCKCMPLRSVTESMDYCIVLCGKTAVVVTAVFQRQKVALGTPLRATRVPQDLRGVLPVPSCLCNSQQPQSQSHITCGSPGFSESSCDAHSLSCRCGHCSDCMTDQGMKYVSRDRFHKIRNLNKTSQRGPCVKELGDGGTAGAVLLELLVQFAMICKSTVDQLWCESIRSDELKCTWTLCKLERC